MSHDPLKQLLRDYDPGELPVLLGEKQKILARIKREKVQTVFAWPSLVAALLLILVLGTQDRAGQMSGGDSELSTFIEDSYQYFSDNSDHPGEEYLTLL